MNLLYKLEGFLDAGPFDILSCHFGPNGLTGILLKELGIPGKVITTFHGYDSAAIHCVTSPRYMKNSFTGAICFFPSVISGKPS